MITTNKSEIIKKFATHQNDTGSADVQVALLTQRINELTSHLKTHAKDFSTKRGLLKLVGQRKRLLRYIERQSSDTYKKLIEQLNLRK